MAEMKTKDLLNELGTSGTQIVGGFIEEDYRSDLQGAEGYRIYEQMRKSDAQIFATLLAMELPIRQTRWYIEPGKDEEGNITPQSQEIADYINRCLFEAMEGTFDDFLRQALTMLPFGFSVFEKVYGVKDSKIYLKKLGFRKQTSIQKWQTFSQKPGITQTTSTTDDKTEESQKNMDVSIPMEKLLVFSFRKEGLNYDGVSILRSAYKHWYIKDKLYKFDAVKQERLSVGIPVIYLPRGASENDKAEAQRIARNVRSTEQTGIVMPGPKEEGRLFEFADTKASSNSDLFESIKHHNREIAKNILAQFLELGDTQSGSRSLGEDQSNMFLLSLGAIANQISETISTYLIKELVDLNFMIEDNYYPTLKYEKLQKKDGDKFATTLSTLIGSGVLSIDDTLEKFVRDKYDLPAREEQSEDKKEKEDDKEDEEENKKEVKMSEHTCNHHHGEDDILNQKYFQDLNSLIDQKFLIDMNTSGNTIES